MGTSSTCQFYRLIPIRLIRIFIIYAYCIDMVTSFRVSAANIKALKSFNTWTPIIRA